MTASNVIESYVDEVVRRLPRKMRNDVGMELRELLHESLGHKAQAAGRPADEALVLDMLRDFGAPGEVADRYGPPGFVIIEPRRAAAFAWLGLGGVTLQWLVTLPPVFLLPQAYAGESLARLGQWWVTLGLAAFWWPGFLVSIAIVAAWMKAARGEAGAAPDHWTPRTYDPDRISRPAWIAAMIAATLGAGALMATLWAGEVLPAPAAAAFSYDPGFLRFRAPWVLAFWASQLVLFGLVMVKGRWTPLTRRMRLGSNLLVCALLAWLVFGGPIFEASPSDGLVRGVIALLGLFLAGMTGREIYRELIRVRPTRALAPSP